MPALTASPRNQDHRKSVTNIGFERTCFSNMAPSCLSNTALAINRASAGPIFLVLIWEPAHT
jgi:hypothetical protein